MRYRWFADGENDRLDEFGLPKTRTPEISEEPSIKKISRAERSGMLISAVVFAYGVMTRDVPIIYVSVAFLIYELSALTQLLGEKSGRFWGNLLRSFSIALFFGAIVLMFL